MSDTPVNDNNLAPMEVPVNGRGTVWETRQPNGVHPSEAEYMQIANTAYRRFMSLV